MRWGLVYGAALALLVAGAFYSGRQWEQQRKPPVTAVRQAPAPVKQHVVVVVLSDHLDQSERLLVELKHAEPDSPEAASALSDQARNLLVANRICRQDVTGADDPALAKALDRLDRLLAEMASQPGGLDAAALARLQDEMNSESLLFQVRVLRSGISNRRKAGKTRLNGGAI
jgi:hypothetical protein